MQFSLAVGRMERNQSYVGILSHLFSLKTLKKVTIDFGYDDEILAIFSRLKVCGLQLSQEYRRIRKKSSFTN